MLLERLKRFIRKFRRTRILVLSPTAEHAQRMLKALNEKRERVGYCIHHDTLEIEKVKLDDSSMDTHAVDLIDEKTPIEEITRILNYEGGQTIITTDLALIDFKAAHHSFSMVIGVGCTDYNFRRFKRFRCIEVE